MNLDEFLSSIKSNGATLVPGSAENIITLASSNLQHMRAATFPQFIIDLYKKSGGIIMGDAYIFGPEEINILKKFPVPSIVQINQEISGIQQMRGKTVFGRNDLFWFAFDAFGTCMMMDNITMRVMRKYEDPLRAINDCIIVGKM